MFIMNRRIATLIFVVTTFASSRTAEDKDPVNPDPHDNVCNTPECREMGIMLSQAIDSNRNPCDDFYDYVCKNWKQNNTIPPYLPSYGHIWSVREELSKRLKDILNNMTTSTCQAESLNDKIAMAYQSCMKEDLSQPEEEISRLRKTLKEFGIPKWPLIPSSNATFNWKEIYRKIRVGADISFIFSVDVSPHLFNTSQLAIDIDVSKFVPSLYQIYMARQYNDSAVEAYEDFIKQTVILFSEEEDINVTTKIAQDIFDFEVNLTKNFYNLKFEFDYSDYNMSYDYAYYDENDTTRTIEPELLQARSDESTNPPEKEPEPSTKLKDVDRKLKSEGWLQLLKDIFQDVSVNLTGEEEVNAFNERFLTGAMKLLNETSGVTVNNYFGWRLLYKLGPIASHNMTTLNFNFNKVWRGLQGQEPRWRHCVSALNDPYEPIIGYGLGKLYVDKYFNSAQKKDVESIAETVRDALRAVIRNYTWMDNETKEEAQKKLKNVVFKIGYPEEIHQEDVLRETYKHVGNVSLEDPFLDTYLSFRKNNAIRKLQKVHRPHNRSQEWRHDVTEVVAVYGPLENSVGLTAVTLQPPFYSSGLPSSVKMGSLGWILGHELNHGFFYPGNYHNGYGNKRLWWNEKTTQNFNPLESCVVKLYDGQTEEETGLNISGYRTFVENIANMQALQTAFEGHQELLRQQFNTPQRLPCVTEFNADQLFFISLAYSFCKNDREAEMRDIVERDSHAPSKIRVNRQLGNSPLFLKTFSCNATSRMNITNKCYV
ncbi:neprilysin-1-like [Ixodes scapularis]|uniref:neprilysin-1-like n=1 Tax=Ixodes scapularis TaxID=6945 RepID=UPI001A9FB895|nr:neprilysin-1-like [Ixodes scapularis]